MNDKDNLLINLQMNHSLLNLISKYLAHIEKHLDDTFEQSLKLHVANIEREMAIRQREMEARERSESISMAARPVNEPRGFESTGRFTVSEVEPISNHNLARRAVRSRGRPLSRRNTSTRGRSRLGPRNN